MEENDMANKCCQNKNCIYNNKDIEEPVAKNHYPNLTDLKVDRYICSIHPQELMRDLGITYQHCTPQSLYDMWQFWNCENVPDKLPECITRHSWNPAKWIGYGLSEEDGKKIMEARLCPDKSDGTDTFREVPSSPSKI